MLTFAFACGACGHQNHADLANAGKAAFCAGCGRQVIVPAPREPSDGAAPLRSTALLLKFRCPQCNRKFSTKPELAGSKTVCGGCGTRIKIPAGGGLAEFAPSSRPASASPPANARPSAAAEAAVALIDHLVGALPEPLEPAPGTRRSRRSKDPVDTVLPSRAEAMEEVRQSLEAQAEEKAKAAKKKKKPSVMKKRIGGTLEVGDLLNVLGFVVAASVVLGSLAWAYPDARFPLGGVLVGFSQIARDEGLHFSLACRFVPLYKWYYLFTRWADTKDYAAFFVAGALVMSTGGLLIKTSPVGAKAEASERALKALQERGSEPVGIAPPPGGPLIDDEG